MIRRARHDRTEHLRRSRLLRRLREAAAIGARARYCLRMGRRSNDCCRHRSQTSACSTSAAVSATSRARRVHAAQGRSSAWTCPNACWTRRGGAPTMPASSTCVHSLEAFAAEPASFDLVVSSLALHYIADYAGLVRRVATWLAPGRTVRLLGGASDLHRAWHRATGTRTRTAPRCTGRWIATATKASGAPLVRRWRGEIPSHGRDAM